MVGVQEHGPAVACRVVAGQRIPRHRLLAVAADIGIGAQRGRGGAEVDADALGFASAQAPEIGDGESDSAQGGRSGEADAPWRREDRIAAASQRERIVTALGSAELAKDVVDQRVAHLFAAHLSAHVLGMMRVNNAINASGQVMCGLWLASSS